MKKEKKIIKHRILDGNTVVGMVLLTLLSYVLVTTVIGGVLAGVAGIAGSMANALMTRDVVINLVLTVVEIGITIFLIRKSVWGEVMDLWNKKWNKQAKEQENSTDSAAESKVCG